MNLTDISDAPRVYALPNGVAFADALLNGLFHRMSGQPPEALGRVTVIVNTTRMKRRLMDLLHHRKPHILPRIRLLTELDTLPGAGHLARPAPGLRKRLELVQLVSGLLDRQPDLAARASVYDLADSLAALMEEMQDENVPAQVIRDLDVSDLSGHWERAQAFFAIAERFADPDGDAPSSALYQRQVVEALRAHWQITPPSGPVIVAGSTASRGTTLDLMSAVASLPAGAVVLPGYDFDQPEAVWAEMERRPNEDHPQYRFLRLMRHLDLRPGDFRPWADMAPASPARNRLMSLALRPAPVTDAWMHEGPRLPDLSEATSGLTLVEARSPREEAQAIALRLRQAAEDGKRAALISPDRMLTRQVTAALQRWNILPDDSAGLPLHLSAPGRFLRMVAALGLRRLDSAAMLALLKHPLCHSGAERGIHLILTRDLELRVRKEGIPFPEADALRAWAGTHGHDRAVDWANWLIDAVCDPLDPSPSPLGDLVADLTARAERLASGHATDGSGGLWDRQAGQMAHGILSDLAAEADAGGDMEPGDFADLLGALLAGEEVRDRDAPHPQIMIWGTLEARVGGADLAILGGLNEGSWPEAPAPDPWLNRPMRKAAGLLLPERRIGLSAHDFQQAVAGAEVWITRATKSDDAETVTSRWVNRLTNLLAGLQDTGGPEALDAMRERGRVWLNRVAAIEAVEQVPAAPRPAPAPPVAARPRRLSVTRIKTLIRDPYAIYASQVLRLRPLNPLVRPPDALLRGILTHAVLERVVRDGRDDPAQLSAAHMRHIAETALAQDVPWPSTRALWSARLSRIAQGFIDEERIRQTLATPALFETDLKSDIAGLDMTLIGRADRIDRQPDGKLRLYDYKTGKPPTKAEQETFDKQLLITAAMAERGGLRDDPFAHDVADAAFLGVGARLQTVPAPLDDHPPGRVWDELVTLLSAYRLPTQGFASRRMMQKDSDRGDYDQLARFGEWDRTDIAQVEVLT